MFAREHTVKSRGKSYTYIKLVENVWGDNGHEQRELVNLGNKDHWPPERLAKFRAELARLEAKFLGIDYHPLEGSHCSEFGEALALDAIWRRLRIDTHLRACLKSVKVEFDVANAIKVMVFNRLIDPHRKLGLCSWTPRYHFPNLGIPSFQLQHYYRALDYLMAIKGKLEPRIWEETRSLFNSQATLVFYDMTSTYFHGEMAGSQLARHGKSKDGRGDCKQIMLGLLVDAEGMPITHHVLAGNTKDNTTVKQVTDDLKKRFDIRHCIFIGDCGTLDTNSILDLKGKDQKRHYDYITTLKLRRNDQAESLIKALPARSSFLPPPKGEEGKEWLYAIPESEDEEDEATPERVDENEERIRYLATYHPKSARAAMKARKARLRKIRDRLKYLGRPAHERKRKDPPRIIRKYIQNFLKEQNAESLLDWKFHRNYRLEYRWLRDPIRYEKERDGLQIMKTDSTILSDRDVVRGYRTLWRVERAFRELKDNIDIRPNHHRTDTRISGHVFCCVLAYLMENVIDQLLGQAGVALSARKALESLRSIHALKIPIIDHELEFVTPLDKEAKAILKALGIKKPPKHA